MPAISLKSPGDIFTESEIGEPFDGDLVIIVKIN
jgi:hypothetical protein